MSPSLHSRRAGLMAGALLLSAAVAPPLAADNLFVSSTNTKSVMEYDGESGDFEEKFAQGGGLIEPEGLEFGPDGDLYVASRSDEILRYDGEKGNFKGVFASGNGLVDPAGIAFCGTGDDLFVGAGLLEGGGGGNQILRFDGATGAFEAVVGPGAPLDDPEAVVCGPDGKLYVSDTPEGENGEVLRYDPDTNAFLGVVVDSIESGIEDPTGMVFDSAGNLYLSSAFSSEVRRYNGTTGAPIAPVPFIAPGFCGLNEAEGMVFLPNGHLLVASELSDEVIEFSSTGACLGPFVTAGSGKLSEPTFMTLGPSDSEAENDAFRFRKVPKQ